MIQLTKQQRDKQPERSCSECGKPARATGEFDMVSGWRYACGSCDNTFWWGLMQVLP